MKEISDELYAKLDYLGIIPNETRNYNIGKSDYADYVIQPWSIIIDHKLDYFDGDIVKRVLRKKEGDSRKLDYEKIIHICKEKIRQIDCHTNYEESKFPIYKGSTIRCYKDMVVDNGDRMEEMFTKYFFYNSSMDGTLVSNQGENISISEKDFEEYFTQK